MKSDPLEEASDSSALIGIEDAARPALYWHRMDLAAHCVQVGLWRSQRRFALAHAMHDFCLVFACCG